MDKINSIFKKINVKKEGARSFHREKIQTKTKGALEAHDFYWAPLVNILSLHVKISVHFRKCFKGQDSTHTW